MQSAQLTVVIVFFFYSFMHLRNLHSFPTRRSSDLVLVVTPSGAVTTVLITFCPTTNGSEADAVPEATVVPFTVSKATGLTAIHLTIMYAVVCLTNAV